MLPSRTLRVRSDTSECKRRARKRRGSIGTCVRGGDHIDGTNVRFVGEVGGAVKQSLFASARGLLMPIRWDEPFGMVMVEALACGTPVIAFAEGAACEVVVDGRTGFLVENERAMVDAVGCLPRIHPRDCRDWVRRHCDGQVVAAAYERVYRSVLPQHVLAPAHV